MSGQDANVGNASMGQFLSDLWKDLGAAQARPSLVSRPESGSPANAAAQGAMQSLKSIPQATSHSSIATPIDNAVFLPKVPKSLQEAGISADEVGRYVLKFLAARGATTGRKIASHIRLLFVAVEDVLKELRREQFVALKGEAIAGDYTYVATEKGLAIAKEFARECTYFGSVPVTLSQYQNAMKKQSVANLRISVASLRNAMADLELGETLLRTLGPAVNSGRGLFLFGQPGNGKTSIAERVSRAFGEGIWIPRALGVDGQVIRIYDPSIHSLVGKEDPANQLVDQTEIDQRWVFIRRPTVIAGGELKMQELEVTQDTYTGICEAPLQLKSNGGVLLIDDFGRQRMPVDELLNRWIVPLEKRYDLLNLPSGKKVQVPFDQLVIFSTNLEPRDLVDDAFLRRIPYKIEVPNPTREQFIHIFKVMCGKVGITFDANAINYLIDEHYTSKSRAFRACHPRDLLLQIRNLSVYEDTKPTLTRDTVDFAVSCYFSVLS